MAGVAKDARAVLTQAFTPGLIKLLQQDRSPHRFLSALFSPEAIRKPWSIWGPELLGQLKAWGQEMEAISEAERQRSRWPLRSRDSLAIPTASEGAGGSLALPGAGIGGDLGLG